MDTFIPKGQISGPILPAFIMRANVSPGAKLLYAVLCNHAHDKDYCWPSHKCLAGEVGHSVSSVKNWLAELVRAKLLHVRPSASRSSTYVLLRPSTGAASASGAAPFRRGAKFGYPRSNFGYINNSRKNLETIPPCPPCGRTSRASSAGRRGGGGFSSVNAVFEKLRDAYPRKEATELARSAFHRLARRGALPALDVLLAAIERGQASDCWNREHGRFIPLLVNWLRGQRWLDAAPDSAAPVDAAASAAALEQAERVRKYAERMEVERRDPALEAARPAFEAFCRCFADGRRKRGPAWGLWSWLHSQGKAPDAKQADSGMGIMEFLKQWRSLA